MNELQSLLADLAAYRAAQYNLDLPSLRNLAPRLFAEDAAVQLAHPIGTVDPTALVESVYPALYRAVPDLERHLAGLLRLLLRHLFAAVAGNSADGPLCLASLPRVLSSG